MIIDPFLNNPKTLYYQKFMTNNHHEDSLKAAKRAEIERLWFAQEATNQELLEAYKSLDIKKEED